MEMWLKTEDKTFRFPVLPSSFNLENSSIIDSSNILNLGEVAMFGGNNLRTIQISSFFPANDYFFCAYSGFPEPYDCVNMIETWRTKGQQVRLIITNTNINMLVLIDSFTYGERAGTRDVDFTLSLKEYKPININKLTQNTTTTTRPTEKPTTTQQKTHKVKKGDCLWDIAQKYCGKGSRYPELKKANQTKYPKLKNSNVIYVGWELIIPW